MSLPAPYYSRDGITIYHADCLVVMSGMEAGSVDAVVTDPPYALTAASRNGSPRQNDPATPHGRTRLGGGFMGKTWDAELPSVETWAEALRVAKPGAHLLAFGGTRTFHRLTCAIEDAGWEIRDCLGWIYGSGFPKSLDVSKAIDKAAGAERAKVPATGGLHQNRNLNDDGWRKIGTIAPVMDSASPATHDAEKWQGWGTALKPAWEPIILARKPLAGTVAETVLAHGTGALNIDGCRVGTERVQRTRNTALGRMNDDGWQPKPQVHDQFGRWPANLIHDGSPEVLEVFPVTKAHGHTPAKRGAGGISCDGHRGQECPEQWFPDSGSAARFFYCAKASRAERGEGNAHPTVKPLALMRYLCRLVTPPGGIVLDPFAGSGTTLLAAYAEGFNGVGIEQDAHSCAIAARRLSQQLLPFGVEA